MSSGSEFALKLHDSGGEVCAHSRVCSCRAAAGPSVPCRRTQPKRPVPQESPSGKRQKQSPAQQSAPESTGSDFRVQLSSEDSEGQNEAQVCCSTLSRLIAYVRIHMHIPVADSVTLYLHCFLLFDT